MEEIIPKLANSAILGLLLINVARSYAPRLHLIDRPGGRKQHDGAVPTIGGICIYCTFLLAMSLDPALLLLNAVFIVAMGLLVCVGAFDDATDVGPLKKLAIETITAVALVAVIAPPPVLGTGEMATVDAFIVVVMTLCIVNAVNMVDGVDGLAGWLIVVALSWLTIAAMVTNSHDVAGIAGRLAMPVLAFLAFNSRAPWRHRAAVFMGDAGTLMLGYAICWFCLEVARNGIPIIASSLVVAVPVSDTISLFFRRLMSGRSPFSADRNHMHHLLEEAGLRPGGISLVLAATSAVIGGIGILGAFAGLPMRFFLIVWAIILVCHCLAVGWLTRKGAQLHLRVARGGAK
jgi:UDP-GlcNAc:undecaprenyl-phosphate GlcNAc-1-phosphate transferase